MYQWNLRPLLAVAAGAALMALGACGGTPATPDAAGTLSGAATGSPATPATSSSPGGPAGGTAGGAGSPPNASAAASGQVGAPAPTRPAAVGAKAAIKACTLVSPAEAGAALPAAGSMQTKTNSGPECEYDSTAGDSVDIEVQAVPFSPDLPNAMTEMLPAAQTKRIDGVGDAAVLFTPAANLAQFYLWKDGLYVVLIVSRSSIGSASGAALSLGRTIAGRV